jgi:outer membrane receptor protein involved in Fe transport
MKQSVRRVPRFSRNILSCALGSCLILVAPAVMAQSTSATLRGAATADATITATNVDTGLTRTTKASDGGYNIAGLPPGTYRIEASAGGQTSSRAVTLAVGQTATLNLEAAPAPEASAGDATTLDTVRVTAPTLVETKTSEVATYVSNKQIELLPQNSRNFLAFADTVPGMLFTTPPNGQESTLRSGAQGASNINVYIDGVGQKNYVTPGGVTSQDDSEGNPFPQLAIGEYKVITSNYKAEYDQISSAAVTAVTKSGTNEFHGNFFWDRTSEDWQRPTPQEEFVGAKAVEKVEQYGVALGGPLIRDKLHFFVTYEAKDIIRPAPMTLPANLPPGTNLPGVIQGPYEGMYSRPFNQDVYFGKLSWQATDNHLIEFTAKRREEVGVLGIGGVNLPEAGTGLVNDEDRYDLRSVYTTENWMNDAHLTFEESSYNPSPLVKEPSHRYTIRNAGNNGDIIVLNAGGGPNFQDKGQKGWALQNDFTFYGWQGHTIKAGVKFKEIDLNAFQQFPPYPRYVYDVNESLTQPYRIEYTTSRVGRDPFVTSSNKQFGIYLQDDWEVTDKLTLNLGLRWDYEDIPSYTDYQPAAGIVTALRNYANIRNTDYDIEDYINDGRRENFKDAWQPRLGFSYDLGDDQRHVIFGGAGRAYDRNLFDLMAREYYGGAFTTYTINFPTPLHSCSGAACVPFNPALLTQAGLDAYATANPVSGGEIQLLNNEIKTPYSDQFSLGMRNIFTLWGHDWNSSVTLSHIRSRDGFYFRLGNRRPDGSFHEYGAQGQTWGGQPWGSNFPVGGGYNQLILADNGFEYNLNSLLVSIDKPYTSASPWGFNLAYTYSDAEENRPNASNGESSLFDYPYASDRMYVSTGVPKHRLVLSGIYSPGWDVVLSGKLVLATPIPKSATNCLDSLPAPSPNYLCYYDPYTPNGTIGFKQFDLAAEKRWDTGTNLGFKVRVDMINVFDWRNWNQFDGNYGTGNGGRLPVNPNLGNRNGREIFEPTRTLKLSFGLDW